MLAGAALLVVAVVVLSFWAFRQTEASSAGRTHTYDLISRAHALLSEIKDAETSQRGYSLTGNKALLEPYLAARRGVSGRLEILRERTLLNTARVRVDTLVPLVEAKFAEMAQTIELRHQRDVIAMLAGSDSGKNLRLMDSIRAELNGYIQIEEGVLAEQEAGFQSSMRQLFVLIVTASLFTFLLALSFAFLVYRETQHRLNNLLHVETQRLLDVQEQTNRQLQQTNFTLHVSEQKLAITLNSIGDAVIATDAQGRVTLMNPLAERLTGWTRVAAFNRSVEEIFHIISQATRLPSVVPVKDTLAHGTVQGLANHTILIAHDGSECDIADSCSPIRDLDNRIVGAVLVFRDVTERQRLDEALQAKNVELESARSVADKANLAKSDFLSSMSHELRTPLSAILGFAQLMESGSPPLTVSQKRSINEILKAGWYLLDLINEILDLALIESGKLSLSMEPIALADVMRECQTMIEPQAQKQGISVVFPRFDIPFFVTADRTRMKQIFINLLSNAIKYNVAGGSVTVDCVAITPRRLRVSVKDTGAGLPPEKLAQLFQPFNRLGKEVEGEEGTGIGLVVCKRLIELMGGVIGMESTVGKGSEFWIELDVTAAPQAIHGMAISTPVASAQVQGDAQLSTLLYVEDNPANLMLVEDLITRRPDIRLLSARDGISGIEMAHAAKPDVILMDINLPGINGMEALQILSQDLATAHIPVIALSANAMPRDIEKGLDAGFFRYLTKPIRVNEFMDTLDMALKLAQTQTTRASKEIEIS